MKGPIDAILANHCLPTHVFPLIDVWERVGKEYGRGYVKGVMGTIG